MPNATDYASNSLFFASFRAGRFSPNMCIQLCSNASSIDSLRHIEYSFKCKTQNKFAPKLFRVQWKRLEIMHDCILHLCMPYFQSRMNDLSVGRVFSILKIIFQLVRIDVLQSRASTANHLFIFDVCIHLRALCRHLHCTDVNEGDHDQWSNEHTNVTSIFYICIFYFQLVDFP